MNKKISKLTLPQDCIIIAALRENQIIIPKGDTILKENDTIITLVGKDAKETFKKLFL